MNIDFYGVPTQVREEIEAFIMDELAGNEFTVMSEDAREEKVSENIRESLWAFNANFIMNHSKIENHGSRVLRSLEKMLTELCEDANELVYALLDDFEDFVYEAVSVDGYGHFLSSYDGVEHEITIDGETYYIYRN